MPVDSQSRPRPVPRELGYLMPAEWEPHAATWLTWPRREGISFPGRFDHIPGLWVRIVEWLGQHEEVHINTYDDQQDAEIIELLAGLHERVRERVFLHRFPAYEPWCRDHGPIFLTRRDKHRSQLAVVNWVYNAWGNKYPPYELDDAVPQHVARFLNVPLFQPEVVLEGGAIDVNGRGTLLTTESCLLHPNRNPNLDRKRIEQYLRDYLGVAHILWLVGEIAGDDTDGHVDDLVRFVGPRTVVAATGEDPADDDYAILRENLRRLRTMCDQDGRPLTVVPLPMPSPVFADGQRLPASYANFYVANGLVLLPTFDEPKDAEAAAILQKLFPDRQIVGVPARDLIWGLGAVHCITQQQPAV